MINEEKLESETKRAGSLIIEHTSVKSPHFWEPFFWERQAIEWVSSDPAVKNGALRFVDVFPSLASSKSIVRHMLEYLPREVLNLHLPHIHAVEDAVEGVLGAPLAIPVRAAVARMAGWFIAGATMEQAARALDRIIKDGMTYTLDLLGEATLSEKEADAYAEKYVNLIRFMAAGRAHGDPAVNVSLKLSSLSPRFGPICPEFASAQVARRLRPIFRAAMESGAQVNIDMEKYELRDLTLAVFRSIMEEDEFREWEGAGIVAQAYLMDAEESLDSLIGWATGRGKRISVRLVKGAYWDSEVITARANGWPVPVFTDKGETDECFEKLTVKLLANTEFVNAAIATHNIRSMARAVAAAKELNVPAGRFEIQMLYGMADPVKKALAEMGIPVRVYAPFGELLPGMAYLVRRILENSSNESFLRHFLVEMETGDALLEKPAPMKAVAPTGESTASAPRVFVNEPAPRFHLEKTRNEMDAAIELVSRRLGKHYQMIIGGQSASNGEFSQSLNPSDPSMVVGHAAMATPGHAAAAMETAHRAFKEWRRTPVEGRGEIFQTAAALIRERKSELAAWQIFEVGKTRAEALADVDEAIDHLEYFALAALTSPEDRITQKVLGESNQMKRRPRGVGVVISPWNFPMAILAGMTIASLAAGNTVVIKPSSESPVTAALFVDILRDAGIPPGAVNLLFGPGETVGMELIKHPAASFVYFTGSWETGRAIAAAAQSESGFVKILAETGGKNAVIVDESADLDEAVAGVIASAFGYGGQKCSACSRVIVMNNVYAAFSKRLLDAAEGLIVGLPSQPHAHYGPLISASARAKVEKYIELGRNAAKPLLMREIKNLPGHYCGPAVFGDVPPDSAIAQEEIFGPVLTLIRAKGFDGAIRIANGVNYALTGGIYSRTPSNVSRFVERVEAGNIYVNRPITGAVVGRQPFGGFKRSGYGTVKAGSEELLRELTVSVTVSENTVRHGYSPDMG
ncbi:MAG: bifunctional proline dehydrogenase/L-glutamate gamma-semialdehyde dehydrogenase [Nitrospinae bacterium]|nr:bifunctional proline dehydrogenase/L-glutamate gamma-semialdehyde dehydrogenase [Nitrospinota bacterium]